VTAGGAYLVVGLEVQFHDVLLHSAMNAWLGRSCY
jgi:hypothetical protein